ncbi:MAG: DUF4476 domain-containing protein [Bacteroidales bacterium]|nr:DUF4476 domain-containing protein [Bacteroidales bacterium]
MKFFYLFIFSLILGYTLNAQTNNLVVFTENGEEFILFINSVKQNSSPMASVQAKDVAPSCKIRMSFDNKSIPEFNQNFWTESENMEITLVVKQNNKGKYVMRQVSEISRLESANVSNHDSNATYEDPGIAVSNEPVNIQISHPSQTSETVVTTTTVTTEKNPRDMNKHSDKGRDENVSIGLQIGEDGIKINAKDGDEGFNMSITGSESHRKTESKKHSQTISTTTTTTTTTTSGTTIVPAQEEAQVVIVEETTIVRCPSATSNADFNDILNNIKSINFEETKLSTAKQICKSECFSADQIIEINDVFNFEDSRLEFAKYAYDYVYDASKYYKVNSSFKFSSSIDDLNEFLQTK